MKRKSFKQYKEELQNISKEKIIKMMYNLSKTIDKKYISKNQIKKKIRFLNKYKNKGLTTYDCISVKTEIYVLKELLKTKHSILEEDENYDDYEDY